MKMNLYLTEEDIAALPVIGFEPDVATSVRKTLDAYHERVYKQQTGEFLAKQYHKLVAAETTEDRVKLMWEIVDWKQNYKSPYLKDSK